MRFEQVGEGAQMVGAGGRVDCAPVRERVPCGVHRPAHGVGPGLGHLVDRFAVGGIGHRQAVAATRVEPARDPHVSHS